MQREVALESFSGRAGAELVQMREMAAQLGFEATGREEPDMGRLAGSHPAPSTASITAR